jgi:Family of unknown function (DUF5995)
MKCQTIQEVIIRLEKIIEDSITHNDPKGFFAVLYYKVTKRVAEGIQKKEFDDNAMMEKLDVVFANRYIDAYDAYINKKTCSKSWLIAFDACRENKSMVLQHILAGINAHINLDLGIAANETVASSSIESLKKNFYQINQVLNDMIDDVKNDISRMAPGFKWFMPLAKKLDEKLIQFSIVVARDGAWTFSQELHSSNNKTKLIEDRDASVMALGTSLLHPGKMLSFIIMSIRAVEFKTVGKQIELLRA